MECKMRNLMNSLCSGVPLEMDIRAAAQWLEMPVDFSSVPTEQTLGEFLRERDAIKVQMHGGTAVIPISGVLEYELSLWGYFTGSTSYRAIRSAFLSALANPDVERICFLVNSPGGLVTGLMETAELIYKNRSQKPSVSFADPMAASAAIRLAASAGEFAVMETSYVGSVGTLRILESHHGMFVNAGIDARVVSVPHEKGEGYVEREISEDEAAHSLNEVTKLSQDFYKRIATYRGVSVAHAKEKFGGGRMMMGRDAVAAGLADRIADRESVITDGKRSTLTMGHTRDAASQRLRNHVRIG